jgi:hypothetical protein
LIVAELDLGHGGGEQFNNGPNLAANESLLGNIVQYGYFGKKLQLVHASLYLENMALIPDPCSLIPVPCF